MKPYIAILLFKLICFTLTGRMIYVQFHDYAENEDSSSVSYKTFIDDKDEAHPTFSICVIGYKGGIFKESLKTSHESYYRFMTIKSNQLVQFEMTMFYLSCRRF